MKSLAEVVQPDGSTRWELVELSEAGRPTAPPPAPEKPAKRVRKAPAEPTFFDPETLDS